MQSSQHTSYFTPLLFTKKKDDQEQPSTSYTTPRPSRSPRSPSSAAGLTSGASRRRSLTPTGSAALQTVEPPIASLYDDFAGSALVPSASALATYNPISGTAPQIPTLPDIGPENVVTVFGFQESHLPDVLQEFSNCGDILRFFRESHSNWVHLQFGNKYEAQKATLKNGIVLSGSVMIGVQPLTRQHHFLFDGTKDEDPAMKVPESKIEPPQLPTGKDLLLPVPRKQGWSKALELIWGT